MRERKQRIAFSLVSHTHLASCAFQRIHSIKRADVSQPDALGEQVGDLTAHRPVSGLDKREKARYGNSAF